MVHVSPTRKPTQVCKSYCKYCGMLRVCDRGFLRSCNLESGKRHAHAPIFLCILKSTHAHYTTSKEIGYVTLCTRLQDYNNTDLPLYRQLQSVPRSLLSPSLHQSVSPRPNTPSPPAQIHNGASKLHCCRGLGRRGEVITYLPKVLLPRPENCLQN